MSDVTIPVLVLEFQARSLIVQNLLQAEAGIKEYEADWLGNTGQVMRDATGKFAKKGTTVDAPQQPQAGVMPGTMQMPGLGQAQQMTWTAMDMLENGAEITSDLIQGLVQDPSFRQRAGLVAGLAGAKALERILEKSKIDPRLEAKLNDFIAEASQKLADEYGDDKDPFAQAIRTSGTDELPPGVPFEKRMEYDLTKYQAYVQALKNPKKYDKKKELMGKAVKASIPIVAYLGLTLGPEVLIGLAMKESLEAILVSAAVGQAVSFGANKAMDKANIENQWVRAGIDLAVGIAAGGLLASNKHFKVLSKAEQATQKGKKIAEAAIKHTEEGTFYDKLSKPVKEFMDARAKDILDSVKPLQEIKPTGIKLPDMKDVGWLSKGQFFQDSVLAIPKELRSLPPNFNKNLLLKGTDWNSLKSASPNFIDILLFDGAEILKSINKGKNQVMLAVIDGVERKILVAQGKVSRGIDAAGEAIEDAFWWLLPKGMDALDASANWVDDVARKMDDIYESKIKTFRPKVEKDIDDLTKNISQEIDNIKADDTSNSIKEFYENKVKTFGENLKSKANKIKDDIALEIDSLKSMGSAFDWDGGLSESFNPQKVVDDISNSVQDLYKNKIQTIKPRIQKEMDELADHLSQEVGNLKNSELAAKFKGKKAIADQWAKDVSESMETFYNSEIKNLKPNIEKEVKELQRIASQGINSVKTKIEDYQKVTKQWSDDASKALKELYENEIKNFQPNLQQEMAGLKSLMSKQIERFGKQASLTAQNIDTWVNNVSATLKKLYQEKSKVFKENIQIQVNNLRQVFNQTNNSKKKIEKVLSEIGIDHSDIQNAIDNYNSRTKQGYNEISSLKKDIDLLNKQKDKLLGLINPQDTGSDSEKIFKQLMELKDELYEKKATLRIAEGKGYSPQKRLIEAAEILEKEGSTSPRYLWRKAVLKAEVKYGKYLNDIQSGAENSYADLMKSLSENKNHKTNLVFSSNQDIEAMIKIGSKPNPDAFVLDKNSKEVIGNIMDQIQGITNIPLSIHIASITDDVYTFSGSNSIAKDLPQYKILQELSFWKDGSNGFIDLGGALSKQQDVFSKGYHNLADSDTHLKEIIWHEIGHIIENSMPNILKISQALLTDREAEDLLLDATKNISKEVYSKNKKIAQDHFYSPYVGVQYIENDTITGTELISSGFEGLSSPWMTRSMAIRDRESLLYAIAVSEMS